MPQQPPPQPTTPRFNQFTIGFVLLALLGVVWKDVALGASLWLASALLYAADRKRSRAALLAACPLMFYGYGVRLNAAPAVLPLALWSGLVASRLLPALKAGAGWRRLLPFVCGLAYFALLTVAVNVTTHVLVRGHTLYPYQQVLLHDLAAISKETGESQFPDYVVRDRDFSLEAISREYTPGGINSLIYGRPQLLKITSDADNVADLRARWLASVSGHRGAYLAHRWAVFATLTGFNTQDVAVAFYPATGMNNPRQFGSPMNALTRALTSYFFFFSRSIFFRGFFWILVTAGLVYVSLRLRLEAELEAVFVVSLSGLLYALGYFLYAPSAEFRYLWWTALAAAAGAILFAAYAVANKGRLRGTKLRE